MDYRGAAAPKKILLGWLQNPGQRLEKKYCTQIYVSIQYSICRQQIFLMRVKNIPLQTGINYL